jgi:hypothetical protein
VLARVICSAKSYLMSNTDCDYEMSGDESYALEDAIQNRPEIDPYEFQDQPEQELTPLRAACLDKVLRRFNRR